MKITPRDHRLDGFVFETVMSRLLESQPKRGRTIANRGEWGYTSTEAEPED
jgi:hypothetical protein